MRIGLFAQTPTAPIRHILCVMTHRGFIAHKSDMCNISIQEARVWTIL